jgi:hypothetical protein
MVSRMELAWVRASMTMVASSSTTPRTARRRLVHTVRGKAPGRTILAVAVVVVNVIIAKTETAQMRTRATMVVIKNTTAGTALWRRLQPVRGRRATVLAVPRSVRRAEAEKAAGWEDAPGGDVVPSQAVEAETDKRGRHRPPSTRRGMATPAPAALNECEAVGVNRRARTRNVASRRLEAQALVHGCTDNWQWAKPLVHGRLSSHGPGTTTTAAAPPLLGDDDRTRSRALPFTRRSKRGRGRYLDGSASVL